MDYEYLAVTERDVQHAAVRSMFTKQGWEEHLRVPWSDGRPSPVCIMRRPKDQPRMWAERELVELMKRTWLVNPSPRQRMKGEGILEDAQTEADMQTAYRKELQKRNEELQAGIDAVVAVLWEPGELTAAEIFQLINRHLYDLASTTSKEESNE